MMRRRFSRYGLTLIELTAALVVASVLLGGSAYAIQRMLDRTDERLADMAIERVVQAQVARSAATGAYAWGLDGDDEDLRRQLPEAMLRDLEVTHGTSTDLESASIAVGTNGTLAVSVRLPNGACRWWNVPAPSPDPSRTLGTAPNFRCEAAQLLPAGEPPMWDR
jgi:prepilin-type N-terminal cleavage/methylation domain-containing protein